MTSKAFIVGCGGETLSVDEVRRIIRGEKIVRDTGGPVEDAARTPPPRGRSSVPPSGRDKPAGGLEPEPQPGAVFNEAVTGP